MTEKVQVFQTAKGTSDRLTEKGALVFQQPNPDTPSVLVDAQRCFQTLEGFGGAFTESSADTFYKMNPAARAEILKAYFDPSTGIGYNIGRIHINSCDFALGNYAYDEEAGDVELKQFSIEHDRRQIIPLIKAAALVSGQPLQLLASPWSPPAWMKTNEEMNCGGKLIPEYREPWAQYYVRFVREFEKEGLPIWALTVQNEPLAVQTWDSCIYTGEEERDFVRDHLGPALEKAGLLDRVKLLIWDHNRDLVFERAKVVYDDPAAARYVWGTAFHWYMGDHFDNVQLTHDAYPDKKLLFTEGTLEGGPHIDDWGGGERYARSIIQDLNHWTVGWIDWNLLLNMQGGPNHKNNLCSAPILADPEKGTLHYNPSYYYIGQITRFVRPGAQRIISASTLDELETTAFLNPDGRIAVVVMNRTEKSFPFSLKFNGKAVLTESPAHSICTFRFQST